MKKHLFIFAICQLFTVAGFATTDIDCLLLKTNPKITLTIPEWKKEVVQPLQPMNLLHGNVMASLHEEFNLQAGLEQIEDGFCVVLRGVNATVGYTEFIVQIDSRHKPGSCAYNATMEHEDEHIRAHLSVIDEIKDEIRNSIEIAADTIMPVFVESRKAANEALDEMNKEIQEHPSVILTNQKIKAEQEIRNKKIDQQDDGVRINQCIKNDW